MSSKPSKPAKRPAKLQTPQTPVTTSRPFLVDRMERIEPVQMFTDWKACPKCGATAPACLSRSRVQEACRCRKCGTTWERPLVPPKGAA